MLLSGEATHFPNAGQEEVQLNDLQKSATSGHCKFKRVLDPAFESNLLGTCGPPIRAVCGKAGGMDQAPQTDQDKNDLKCPARKSIELL